MQCLGFIPSDRPKTQPRTSRTLFAAAAVYKYRHLTSGGMHALYDPTPLLIQKSHTLQEIPAYKTNGHTERQQPAYFFLAAMPPSSRGTVAITLPSIMTVLQSRKAIRERPSQFLKLSHTSGVMGSNWAWATSLALRWGGASALAPPVSLPIFQSMTDMRHAALPQRTKPMGE